MQPTIKHVIQSDRLALQLRYPRNVMIERNEGCSLLQLLSGKRRPARARLPVAHGSPVLSARTLGHLADIGPAASYVLEEATELSSTAGEAGILNSSSQCAWRTWIPKGPLSRMKTSALLGSLAQARYL